MDRKPEYFVQNLLKQICFYIYKTFKFICFSKKLFYQFFCILFSFISPICFVLIQYLFLE